MCLAVVCVEDGLSQIKSHITLIEKRLLRMLKLKHFTGDIIII